MQIEYNRKLTKMVVDGLHYEAKDVATCTGCAFDGKRCGAIPDCGPAMREDGRSVVWVARGGPTGAVNKTQKKLYVNGELFHATTPKYKPGVAPCEGCAFNVGKQCPKILHDGPRNWKTSLCTTYTRDDGADIIWMRAK